MSMCYELCLPSPIESHDYHPDSSLEVDLDVGWEYGV